MGATPEAEGPRRATSPTPSKGKTTNGDTYQETYATNGKGKIPVRPRRKDDDLNETDSGLDAPTAESYIRDRAISPDQVMQAQARTRSPSQGGPGSRAVSPNGTDQGPPSMMGVTMGNFNPPGRSSPAVDRSKYPADAFYNPRSGSPLVNGYVRPPSRTGNGSVSNVTADLLKEIKVKDTEMESAKKQMMWMKEALSKATKMGYVYAEREEVDSPGASEGASGSEHAELVFKFKSFKAQIQVRSLCGVRNIA
jgi:hypothetical protein